MTLGCCFPALMNKSVLKNNKIDSFSHSVKNNYSTQNIKPIEPDIRKNQRLAQFVCLFVVLIWCSDLQGKPPKQSGCERQADVCVCVLQNYLCHNENVPQMNGNK